MKNAKRFVSVILAFLMTVSMVITIVLPSFAQKETAEVDTYLPLTVASSTISPALSGETSRSVKTLYTGVTSTNIKTSSSSKYDLQSFNIVEFDLKQTDLYIDVTNTRDYVNQSKTTLNTVTSFNSSNGKGKTAVAAINGDLWTMSSAHSRVEGSGTSYNGYSDAVVTKALTLPRGYTVYNGEIVCSSHMIYETPFEGEFWSFGVTNDSVPMIGRPDLGISIKNNTKNVTVAGDGLNRLPANNALVVYSDKGVANNYALSDAYEVVIDFTSDYTVKHGATMTGTVSGIYSSATSSNPTMQSNRIILTARGTALDRMTSFAVGDSVTLSFDVSERYGRNSEGWQNCYTAVGGHMPFVVDGVKQETGTTTNYPTTIVGIKNDGSVCFIVNDGRQSSFSTGLDFNDYWDFADDMDLNTAFILDGGGSANLVELQSDGSYAVVNSPSDGSARSVVNSVILSAGPKRAAQGKNEIVYPDPSLDLANIYFATDDGYLTLANYGETDRSKTLNGAKLTVKDFMNGPTVSVSYGLPNTTSYNSNSVLAGKNYQSVNASAYPYMVIDCSLVSADSSTVQFQALYHTSGSRKGVSTTTFIGFNNAYNNNGFNKYVINPASNSAYSGRLNTLRYNFLYPANGVTVQNGDYMIIKSIRLAKTVEEAAAMNDSPTMLTMTLNANGGSVSQSKKYCVYGKAYGTLPTPVRSGYTFKGWYTASLGGTKINPADTVNYSGAKTFYAQWSEGGEVTPTYYTISFSAGEGSMNSASSYSIEAGAKYSSVISSIPSATRNGYALSGWLCEELGYTLNLSDTFTANKNVTFTAVWTPILGIYKCTASALNVRSGPSSSYTSLGTMANGDQYEVLAMNGKWAKIIFNGQEGWASLNYLEYVGPASEAKYTLTFNLNGGTMPAGYSTTYTFEPDQKFIDVIGGYPVPTRSGYEFGGWQRADYAPDLWQDGWGTQPFTFGYNIILNAVWNEPHSHSYSSRVTTAATCTAAGIRTHTCSCGDSYTESIAATGHSIVSYDAKEATCSSVGWNSYVTCLNCSYSTYSEIPQKGHTNALREENRVEASCTTDGCYDAVTYCSVCQTVIDTDRVTIYALGHSYISHEGKDVTCTEDGWNEYQTCASCDYSDYTKIPAKGHEYNATVTAPTCTAAGSIKYSCTNCTYYYSEALSATGHTTATRTENAVEATCTASGSYDTVTYCTKCQTVISRVTSHTDAKGHSYVDHAAKAPTCTEYGWEAYRTCADCDYTTYKQISSTGHSAAAREENRVEATCTASGSYDTVTYCTKCQTVISRVTNRISAKGHSYVDHEAKSATCTESGWNAYQTCENCDYSNYTEISAKGHNYKKTVTAPTCTEDGYTTYSCTVCGDSYADDESDALGHSEAVREENRREADCVNNGSYDEVTYCTVCDTELFRETVVIPANDHNYETEVTAPGCTEDGYTVYTCTGCGDSYTDDIITASGHSYDEDVTEADCTNGGYTVYTCTECGDSYTDDYTEALGHDYEAEVTEATCTEDGYTIYTCIVCSDSYVDDEVDALGHEYEVEVTEATCTTGGYTTYTCAVCEDSYIDNEVEALGHTEKEIPAVEASCTETGFTAGTECSVCGEVLVEQTETEALGHSYEAEVTAPTCIADGYTTYTCAVCGDSYEDEYTDAAGHNEATKEENIVEAVCGAAGSYELVYYCDICGEEFSRETIETEALVHSYEVEGLTLDCIYCADGYNGFYFDEEENKYYSVDGTLVTGLFTIEEKYYYANEKGIMYRNGRFLVEDDALENGYYNFDEEGAILFPEGYTIVNLEGNSYLMQNGERMPRGLYEYSVGKFVYAGYNGVLLKDAYMWVSTEFKSGLIAGEGCVYYFGSDFMLETDRFVEYDGLCYYIDSDATALLGFNKIGEDYYYFNAKNGKMYRDTMIWVGANDYGVAEGNQYFGEDGKMYIAPEDGVVEIIEENGKLYYTIDGVKQFYGLYELDGEYYYAQGNGTLAVSEVVWVSNTNGLISSKGYYSFDAEGRLIKSGFVNAPTGYTYYYDNCVLAKGLTKIGNDYYMFNISSGMMYHDANMWIGADNAYGFAAGYYTFMADGKMYIAPENGVVEIIEENGELYYTVDGVKQSSGVYENEGEYYYVKGNKTLYRDTVIWVTTAVAAKFGSAAGYYAFDNEGKLVQNGFIEAPNGYTYYRSELELAKGLTKIGEDHYFFNVSSGSMYKDANMWIGADNAYGFAAGYYYFDADGRMG